MCTGAECVWPVTVGRPGDFFKFLDRASSSQLTFIRASILFITVGVLCVFPFQRTLIPVA